MQCPTPSLTHLTPNKNTPIVMHYGFVMDGVKNLLNISHKFGPISYHPDPKLHKFKSVKKYKANEKLVFNVSYTVYNNNILLNFIKLYVKIVFVFGLYIAIYHVYFVHNYLGW